MIAAWPIIILKVKTRKPVTSKEEEKNRDGGNEVRGRREGACGGATCTIPLRHSGQIDMPNQDMERFLRSKANQERDQAANSDRRRRTCEREEQDTQSALG